MHLVRFFQYREFAFRRAKRAEGGFQPIKALLGCPEHGEEAWCKISARSVESFHSYGQKTAVCFRLCKYIYIFIYIIYLLYYYLFIYIIYIYIYIYTDVQSSFQMNSNDRALVFCMRSGSEANSMRNFAQLAHSTPSCRTRPTPPSSTSSRWVLDVGEL